MEKENDKVKSIFEWHKIKIKIQLSEERKDMYFYEKDVWWASLGVNIGHEEDGKNKKFGRPVLIFKKFNRHLVLVIPLTSKIKIGKFYYYKFACSKSEFISAMICQVRLISSKRLFRKMGVINNNDYIEIKNRIKNYL